MNLSTFLDLKTQDLSFLDFLSNRALLSYKSLAYKERVSYLVKDECNSIPKENSKLFSFICGSTFCKTNKRQVFLSHFFETLYFVCFVKFTVANRIPRSLSYIGGDCKWERIPRSSKVFKLSVVTNKL